MYNISEELLQAICNLLNAMPAHQSRGVLNASRQPSTSRRASARSSMLRSSARPCSPSSRRHRQMTDPRQRRQAEPDHNPPVDVRAADLARLHERMDDLGSEISLIVGPAVAKGIKEAISDPATWTAVFSMAHREAADGLGRFGLSTVWGAMRWMLRFTVLAWWCTR